MKANADKIKRVFIGEKRNDNVLIRLLFYWFDFVFLCVTL